MAGYRQSVLPCTISLDPISRQVLSHPLLPCELLTAAAVGQSMAGEVTVPTSVPGLVRREVLVMSYVEGLPITRAQVSTRG